MKHRASNIIDEVEGFLEYGNYKGLVVEVHRLDNSSIEKPESKALKTLLIEER